MLDGKQGCDGKYGVSLKMVSGITGLIIALVDLFTEVYHVSVVISIVIFSHVMS